MTEGWRRLLEGHKAYEELKVKPREEEEYDFFFVNPKGKETPMNILLLPRTKGNLSRVKECLEFINAKDNAWWVYYLAKCIEKALENKQNYTHINLLLRYTIIVKRNDGQVRIYHPEEIRKTLYKYLEKDGETPERKFWRWKI